MLDVSVILLTYNQKEFVTQSIDSILTQQFSGSWEIIIGDDSSIDGTFDIISNIANLKFDLIKVYRNGKNLGLSLNYEKAILMARGKYVAYLEGDDYWTDSNKIQKQFDFLEANPNFVLAFHDFITVNENNTIISDQNLFNNLLKGDRSQKEMATGCLIHQNTIMIRNVVRKFPMGFFLSKNHDGAATFDWTVS